MRRGVVVAVIVAGVVAMCFLYYYFDPAAEPAWFPRCAFHAVTGMQCPGCGLQRAAHALLHGDVASALRYNALLPLLLLMTVALAVGEWWVAPDSKFGRVVRHPVTAVAALVVILVWWVVRNLLGI